MISRSILRQASGLRNVARGPSVPTWHQPLRICRPSPYLNHPRAQRYSSNAESTAESSEKKAEDKENAATEKSPEDLHKEQVEAKDTEIRDLKDKYLRSVADFRNLQDRTSRDMASARDFAISRFAKDLIDSVDNLDRALSAVPHASLAPDSTNKELKDLHGGLKMTESVLMQALAKHGLVRFDPSENGDKFDPNLHEASFMTKIEGKPDGTVFNTIQKGYTLNGRVIRAAKVGVVKNT